MVERAEAGAVDVGAICAGLLAAGSEPPEQAAAARAKIAPATRTAMGFECCTAIGFRLTASVLVRTVHPLHSCEDFQVQVGT